MNHFGARQFAPRHFMQRHIGGRKVVLVDANGGQGEIGEIREPSKTDAGAISSDGAMQLAVLLITSGALNWEL